jgi:hypothetical protein
MMPREQVMTASLWILPAASVTEVRRTPSISARSSWVRGTVSLAARSLQQPAAEPCLDGMLRFEIFLLAPVSNR